MKMLETVKLEMDRDDIERHLREMVERLYPGQYTIQAIVFKVNESLNLSGAKIHMKRVEKPQ